MYANLPGQLLSSLSLGQPFSYGQIRMKLVSEVLTRWFNSPKSTTKSGFQTKPSSDLRATQSFGATILYPAVGPADDPPTEPRLCPVWESPLTYSIDS